MEACAFHPDHAAVEYCEVCEQPLCGLCLWYTADGHRLCRAHARERSEAGEQVLPPQTYHEAIEPSLVRSPAGSGDEPGIYRGNRTDLSALVAAVAGVITLLSCMGGVYCLPLAVLLLGGSAYLNAGQAVDALRTRRLAAIAIGIVAFMLLLVFAFVFLYVAFFVILVVAGSGP
jgi:hypothetical protein